MDNRDITELTKLLEKSKKEFQGARILNPQNFKKFSNVFDYLKKLMESRNGEIIHVDVKPESLNADVSIKVKIIDFYTRAMLEEFVNILKQADVLGITPSADDHIIIDMSVNNVWEEHSIEQNNE